MAKSKKKRQGEWVPTVFLRWSITDRLQQKWVRQRYAWNPETSTYRSWMQEEWREIPDENPLATTADQPSSAAVQEGLGRYGCQTASSTSIC